MFSMHSMGSGLSFQSYIFVFFVLFCTAGAGTAADIAIGSYEANIIELSLHFALLHSSDFSSAVRACAPCLCFVSSPSLVHILGLWVE